MFCHRDSDAAFRDKLIGLVDADKEDQFLHCLGFCHPPLQTLRKRITVLRSRKRSTLSSAGN
jgi:hypothetical protein